MMTTVGWFAAEGSLGTIRRYLRRRQSCFLDGRLLVEDDLVDAEDVTVVLDKEEVGYPLFDIVVVAVVLAVVAVAVVAVAAVVAVVVAAVVGVVGTAVAVVLEDVWRLEVDRTVVVEVGGLEY